MVRGPASFVTYFGDGAVGTPAELVRLPGLVQLHEAETDVVEGPAARAQPLREEERLDRLSIATPLIVGARFLVVESGHRRVVRQRRGGDGAHRERDGQREAPSGLAGSGVPRILFPRGGVYRTRRAERGHRLRAPLEDRSALSSADPTVSSNIREAIAVLTDGKAYTHPEPDWGLITELLGVDLEEYDCDYDHYILERIHPSTFVQGDIQIDGDTSARALVEGRDGYTPPTEYNDTGVVILGNLEVSGNLALDELTPLFVSGHVKAGSITNCYGTLVVGGSIDAPLIYCVSADEGGQIHTDDCQTKLLIDGSGTVDYHCGGDYPFLLANHYSPRQRYTLERSLADMGFEDFGTTHSSEVRDVVAEGKERIAVLLELIENNRDAVPDNVPENAEWSDDYPSGYRLDERDENGQPHGVDGHWAADGTIKRLKQFKHGTPHGKWVTEHGGKLLTQHFVDGELARPEGVPEDAIWKQDDREWEQAPTDDDGEKHGLVRWWRADGSLVCETPYVHGKAEGEGRRYHESGELSQTFHFVGDKLHGERTWYPTDTETSETATQGFGANVARIVSVYEDGNPVGTPKCYDADGTEVDRYGRPLG